MYLKKINVFECLELVSQESGRGQEGAKEGIPRFYIPDCHLISFGESCEKCPNDHEYLGVS